MGIKKFFGHLHTILHHKRLVLINCSKCGLIWQGIIHDMSKFSFTEFIPGVKYFQGSKSPNEKEREIYGYSLAWMHHKGRNKHHYEYWNDYNPLTKKTDAVKMPPKYLAEMICDRIAASKTYKKKSYTNSSPIEYYINGTKKHNSLIHPDTAKELERLLTLLSEKGEGELFKELRAIIKNGKY